MTKSTLHSVLLVEGHQPVARFLAQQLLGLGVANVQIVPTYKEAVRKLEKSNFDVIFCAPPVAEHEDSASLFFWDLHVQNLLSPTTFTVAITPKTAGGKQHHFLEGLVTDTLSKPFTGNDLDRVVARLEALRKCLRMAHANIRSKSYIAADVELGARAEQYPEYAPVINHTLVTAKQRHQGGVAAFTDCERRFQLKHNTWLTLVCTQGYLDAGQLEQAADSMPKAQEPVASTLIGKALRARVYLAQGDVVAAVQEIKKLPYTDVCSYYLAATVGIAAAAAGDGVLAKSALERAFELSADTALCDPKHLALLCLARYKVAPDLRQLKATWYLTKNMLKAKPADAGAVLCMEIVAALAALHTHQVDTASELVGSVLSKSNLVAFDLVCALSFITLIRFAMERGIGVLKDPRELQTLYAKFEQSPGRIQLLHQALGTHDGQLPDVYERIGAKLGMPRQPISLSL